jgi:predicted N-acetyltransferase YhbS
MIRPSTESDRAGISAVHLGAFGEIQGPEIVALVNGLSGDGTARPLLSLLAESEGAVVGHILFTRVSLHPGHPGISARILAPLAVAKPFQGKGVGGRLIVEGLKRLAASGDALVFVLGHPGYYPRHGFRPAGILGFEAPYPIPPEHADAWMVQELKSGVIASVRGRVQCARTLDEPRHWRE